MNGKKQTDAQIVAQLAGCSPARVRALIKSGKIPASTKGRQLEITISIEDAAKIVREGQRKYQKKSRIIWHSSDEMPKAGSFILMYGDNKTWHLTTYSSASADIEYVKRFKFWAYLTPEMLPVKGNYDE